MEYLLPAYLIDKPNSFDMRYLIILLTVFTSCDRSAISKKLSKADKLEIRYSMSQSDVIEKSITTANKHTMNKVIGFLDNSPTVQFTCGYDGKLIFFAGGEQLHIIDFMSDKDCRHFSFMVDEKIMSIKMSNTAAEFFTVLKE